jgi:hypothetical protein
MDAAHKAFRWAERSGQAERRAKASVSIPCVDVLVAVRRQEYSWTRARAVSASGREQELAPLEVTTRWFNTQLQNVVRLVTAAHPVRLA